MKAISYSLFGYGKAKLQENFPFDSYLRGLSVNLRMSRLIYPGWRVCLNLDRSTYEAFKDYFDALKENNICDIEVINDAPLCLSMLWRLKPVFKRNWSEKFNGFTDWTFTHVICRDLDCVSTYKEAQAVQVWINNDKAVHAITDSDSHSVPLMGGMIGFRPHYITEICSAQTWEQLINKYPMDFNAKGTDQTFLNQVIYPKVSQPGKDSITQHYFEGMPKTYLGDYHTCKCVRGTGHDEGCPNNIKLEIDDKLKESNYCTGHIGAGGYYPTACSKLFAHYDFSDLKEIEKLYPNIFVI